MGHLVLALLSLALLSALGACTSQNDLNTGQTITVAAASSLRPLYQELGVLFETVENDKVVFVFGASGSLAQQIKQGAQLDIFASANAQFVNELGNSGLIDNEYHRTYAVGSLALAITPSQQNSISSLFDLLSPEVRYLALANPSVAPYGLAAQETLESLNLLDRLRPKIVYSTNVRQALQFVETGNADAAVVSRAIITDEVTHFPIDPQLHNPILQSIALIKTSKHPQAARRFIEFISANENRMVLESYGFSALSLEGAP